MKIRRAMLFCMALLFILSLGFSAVSATDSDDFNGLGLDEGLVLSDSIDENINDLSCDESDSFMLLNKMMMWMNQAILIRTF